MASLHTSAARCQLLISGRKKGLPSGTSGIEPPTNAGDPGDPGSIPGMGRSPGEGNSNAFYYSCLENPMDIEAWKATVYGVTKSLT